MVAGWILNRRGGVKPGLGPFAKHGVLQLGEGPHHLHHHAARRSAQQASATKS